MKVAALFSGGKDSTYSVWWAKLCGWDVSCLLTLIAANESSYMFHTPNIQWTRNQATVMGIPHLLQETKGEKEKELSDLKQIFHRAKTQYGVTGIVVGALASEYQRMRVNQVAYEEELKVFAPLWHNRPQEYMEELISSGFRMVISSVAADGFSREDVGRVIDKKYLKRLFLLVQKHKIHWAFEGGEAETFVLDCPLFSHSLHIKKSSIVMETENCGMLKIEELS